MLSYLTNNSYLKTRYRNIRKHPLVKNSLLYVLTDAINKAVPFLILPVLTHYLIPSDYGIVANYNVYINFLIIFIGINVQSILSVNFYKIEKSKLSEYIFNIVIVVTTMLLACGIVVLLFSEQLEKYLSVGLSYLLAGLLIAVSQVISSLNLTLWRLEERPIYFGSYQISQTILDTGISLILIIGLNMSWAGRIAGIGLSSVLCAFFSFILLAKRGYLTFSFNKQYIKEAFKFGLPLIPHSLSIWARAGADRLIVSTFAGVSASGLYAAGFQFGLVISFLTLAFSNAYAPFLYKTLAIEDKHLLATKKKQLVKFTYLYIAGLMLLTLMAVFGSNFVIDNFLSSKYSGTKIFIGWALFAQAFQGVYLMFAGFIFFAKKSASLAWVTFLCSSLQVALSYFLVKKIGPVGAAYSNFAISVLNCFFVMLLSSKVYQMPWLEFNTLSPKHSLGR
ncbi:lipopolysaccharide biosynthesis protein [Dyadobacter aurulentus]|uniref:lipopolysaccharide biosynthesis protein n=1 Tax=Dyadobacter sp. UC 10 TaxID=2605428 RepID=UPI0011F31CC8|nr:oligosaccharide flippase family protein [Dyadobacter sp. UC 10]KAA0991309.1 oligosaccharide flippase family protein [Dyadobacter sp. UC 10]